MTGQSSVHNESGLRCAVTGRPTPRRHLTPLGLIRPEEADRIRKDHPDLPAEALIGREALDAFRGRYVEELLKEERGEITELEREVVKSLTRHETISENLAEPLQEQRTTGEALSDRLAEFGGSWTFILLFAAVLAAWIGLNLVMGMTRAFDPYPFILLNLVLSCIAAIQAPVIMMSQKRMEAKDRRRAVNDYRVNLKAELEIRHLHEKLDHLLTRQWERMAEIQKVQVELLQDLAARRAGR